MKQALVEGAVPIPGIPMYEQGQGKLNLINSMAILQSYQPKASIVPKALDFTDCPYMWPFCTQPIYANALPLIFNATVLNAMALTGNHVAALLQAVSSTTARLGYSPSSYITYSLSSYVAYVA